MAIVIAIDPVELLPLREIGSEADFVPPLQGGLDPNKISGVGTNFGLLVHVLPGPNKQREAKPSILLS